MARRSLVLAVILFARMAWAVRGQSSCDANGTCTHPTGGQASCDDGDPCTADDVCDAGVCAGTFVLEGCIDTVQCHRSRRESGFDSIPVGMDDQFAPALLFGTAGRPHDLCLPASTTSGKTLPCCAGTCVGGVCQ